MSTAYLGSLSVAALNPTVALTIMPELTVRLGELNDLYAELQAKLVDINAKLTAIASVSIPNPVSLTAGLQAALLAVAQIAVQFPAATVNIGASLTAELALVVALAASIQVKITALAALIADLNVALGGVGLALYSYQGRADRLGDEVGAELASGLPGGGGPGDVVDAIVVACATPSEWAKFGVLVKVEA